MTARIVIADDHAVVREGLREMINRCPDLRVVGEAGDGHEAERLAAAAAPDLVVLDVTLPGRSGIEVLQALRAAGARVPVLFFSMHPAAQYADYVRRAGAQGFVDKNVDSAALIAALRRLLAGGEWFPRRPRRGLKASPLEALSAQEQEVMRGLVRGEAIGTIAERLGVSPKTVSTYRRRLLDKLGLSSNAELASLMTRHGVA